MKNLTCLMILGIAMILTFLSISCAQKEQISAHSHLTGYQEVLVQTSPDTPTLKKAYLNIGYYDNRTGYTAYLFLTDIPVEFVIFDEDENGKIDSRGLYIVERDKIYLNTQPMLIPAIGFNDYNETEYYRARLLLDQIYPHIKSIIKARALKTRAFS